MAIKVNEQHLGDIAIKADALAMVECLRGKGYDASYGEGSTAGVADSDWDACMDEVNARHNTRNQAVAERREKFSAKK